MSNITGKGRSVAIVGGGIVGSCLARLLSERGDEVTLIEQGGGGDGGTNRLPGSTGIAPGFVGQLHTVDALRILAQRTVAYYKTIPGAFAAVGGMEVACSRAGLEDLDERLALARQTGVSARFLTAQEAIALEPRLLLPADNNGADNGGDGRVLGAVLYPDDGTADARHIVRHEQEQARKHGARMLHASVRSVLPGLVTTMDDTTLKFDDVVVCSGIWTRALLPRLPAHAVAHPYIYSAPHDATMRPPAIGVTPFIRWPQCHVYARDHGTCFGMGSYDHAPILAGDAATATLTPHAKATWQPGFTATLRRNAAQLLPNATVEQFGLATLDGAALDDNMQPDRAFNGLFAVTPDGKPLAGLCDSTGSAADGINKGRARLYACAAVWVTTAFGTAQLIANEMHHDDDDEEHERLCLALDPHRFDHVDEDLLTQQALSTYNDIYIKKLL